MRLLLDAGANPNLSADGGTPHPVTIAAGLEESRILHLLLKYGGDPNADYPDSAWTALRVAFGLGMEEKGWENYRLLRSAGADINRIHAGTTIAEFATAMNQYDKVFELLQSG